MSFLTYKQAADNIMRLAAGVTYSECIAREMAPSMDNNMMMLSRAYAAYNDGNVSVTPEHFVESFMKIHNLERILSGMSSVQMHQVATINLSKAALYQFTQGPDFEWGADRDGNALAKFDDMVFRIRVAPTRDGGAGFLVERYVGNPPPLQIDHKDIFSRYVPLDENSFMRVSGTFDIRDAVGAVEHMVRNMNLNTSQDMTAPSA